MTTHRQLGYYAEADCSLEDFAALTAQSTAATSVPQATTIRHNIPCYDVSGLQQQLSAPDKRAHLMAEWASVLGHGAGVFILHGAVSDMAAIDQATDIYNDIIRQEREANISAADHFAAAGNNDRIWNSLQKLCLASPDVFIRYFAHPAIDAACEAWLGPNYQMTAQVNQVRPGGKAQQAHRDYHLGFQTAEVTATYPAHVHDLSPLMTLQGGIAHCDVPIDSGPTKLLPFSQLYRPGYVAWRRPDFRAHFEANCVQLPLQKGDALFFNPALFHAAGENVSADVQRMVNLLQISSAFGRAMESIDRAAMCRALCQPLSNALQQGQLDLALLSCVASAAAEGYSFPTNLDRDPPEGGLAPITQKQLLIQAVTERWDSEQFAAALDERESKQRP